MLPFAPSSPLPVTSAGGAAALSTARSMPWSMKAAMAMRRRCAPASGRESTPLE